ncbi:MAG TPA: hypothetical protein VFT49_02685 [Candidatus Saccharimonadales bacterium]|nr:hypothetical protein [Candidatus Saccharimonadales bacterium]
MNETKILPSKAERIETQLLRVVQASGAAAACDIYIKFLAERESARTDKALTYQRVALV